MRRSILAPALAFIAPALLSLLYTFVLNHFDRGLVWDSAHYVLSSSELLKWTTSCLQGHYVAPANSDLGISLMVDGPVLPTFGAIMILIGRQLGATAEASILTGQSFVCGLNSFLLYWLGRRLGAGRKLSLIAGLLLGLNPATIVSASQFLTEQLTVTVLLTFTLTTTGALPRGKLNGGEKPSFFQYGAYIILGALCTLVLHLKTALFPSVTLVLLLALIARKNSLRLRANIIVAMAMGFFIALVPWLAFSKVASGNGRMSLGPNRVPSINLAVGMDLDSDAWGVAPPTDSVMPIIFDKPSAIVASLWQGDQFKMSCLFLRKTARLFAYSWNDFGWSVFGLNWYWQCLLQRLLLCGAMLGMIYLLFQEKLLHNHFATLTNVDFLKLTILLMVAGHFIFVPFETQPRYGYSAVPFLILLTLVGAQKLRKAQLFPYLYASLSLCLLILASSDLTGPIFALTRTIETAQIAIHLLWALIFGLLAWSAITISHRAFLSSKLKSVLTIALGTTFAFACLTMAAVGEPPPEWVCETNKSTVSRALKIPTALSAHWQHNFTSEKSWAAALIDSDEYLSDATVKINGIKALGAPRLLLDVEQAYAFQSTIKELSVLAARTRGEKESSLRQWRLVQLPASALDLKSGNNVLTVEAGAKPLKLYGQYRYSGSKAADKLFIPSLYGFSALRLSILGDSRTTDIHRPSPAPAKSALNAAGGDLSPSQAGDQQGDYRLYLLLANYQPNRTEEKKENKDIRQVKPAVPNMTFKEMFAEIF
ncbi:MAG: hypothetical protein KGS72_05380 [Cyanobacteria bacterium REEB67]|nr:hypothetical protein [Cyanobacteria bacterium REEB67]